MPDISKITLPSGNTYDIKDATAREMASAGVTFTISTNASSTPKDVEWYSGATKITGTLVASQNTKGTFYLVPTSTQSGKDTYAEYITVMKGTAYIWEKVGTTDIDLSNLGDLAYKDSASVSFKPNGTVSKPAFTGTEGNISVTGTPAGSIGVGTGVANYTPGGEVSAPTVTVTPDTETKYVADSATGGGRVTAGSAASCVMPMLSTSVSDETLILNWTDGSFTPNTPTGVVLPSFTSQTIVSGIQSATASKPSFTGEGVNLTFTGEAMSSSGKFTPSGEVSQPTFTGTQGTVTVS